MKSQDRLNLVCRSVVLLTVLLAGSAQAASVGAIAEERLEPSQLVLEPLFGFERATLTVEGPAGYVVQRGFGSGETVRLALSDDEGRSLPDGRYRYSLRLTPGPASSSDVQKGLFFVDEGSGVSRTARRDQLASIRETLNREERRVQAYQQAAATSQYEEGMSLAPPASYALTIDGDFALGGYVFKGGFPFLHNVGGYAFSNTALGLDALGSATPGYLSNNTAVGIRALKFNTSGNWNTATGSNALRDLTTGYWNTASGYNALRLNTTGYRNTGIGANTLGLSTTGSYNTVSGANALPINSTGDGNTVSGVFALGNNTTGSYNTASGYRALFNSTGDRNIALGSRAGHNNSIGDDNIFIGNEGGSADAATIRIGTAGTHSQTFIAGISGATVSGSAVLVASNGQLGVAASSQRFKQEINDMGEASSGLLALRPVTFRYKEEAVSTPRPVEFGLIAEEVAEIFPDLVVYDEEGQPYTVRYHLLSSLLLNELQKQHRLNQEQGEQLRLLRERLARLEALEAKQDAPREDRAAAP